MLTPKKLQGTTSGPVHLVPIIIISIFHLTLISSAPGNAPGYLGCYVDAPDRVLSIGPVGHGSQSVEWCFEYCLDSLSPSKKYAGLEYSSECFCGDDEDYDKHGKKPDWQCQDTCQGNPDQICGDSYRISMYQISQGVCSNDIGPPTNGYHTITNPRSLSYNLNNFKLYGTRVDFYCDTGFTLQGASSIQCIETQYNNATWSDTVPICQAPRPTTDAPSTAQPRPTFTTESSKDSTTTTGDLATTRPRPIFTTESSKDSKTTTGDLATTQPGPTFSTAEDSKTVVWYTTDPFEKGQPGASRSDTATIIGVTLGLAVALALLATLIVVWRKRATKEKTRPCSDVKEKVDGSYLNNAYGLTEIPGAKPHKTTPDDYREVTHAKSADDNMYADVDDVSEPRGGCVKPTGDDVYADVDDVGEPRGGHVKPTGDDVYADVDDVDEPRGGHVKPTGDDVYADVDDVDESRGGHVKTTGDDVYADVDDTDGPRDGGDAAISSKFSPGGQGPDSGWVDNTLYAGYDSDESETSTGQPGAQGWVDNIIYE